MSSLGPLRRPLSTLSLALSLLLPAGAGSAGEDARALLRESEARHRSRTLQYAGELTVVTKDGKSRTKAWKSYREGYGGDAKTLVRFTAPPEVRGVGFLSLARAGRNADQWLYLPSMKRERRIASQDREASFVGTDFNYEDMEEFDHRKYDVELKGEQVLEGHLCYVIEAVPGEKAGRSLYERRLLYLRKDLLYLAREDLYVRGEQEPVKRLLLTDLQNVDGRWVSRRWEMGDRKKGSRTTVVLKEISFDRPQPADRFTLQNLTREGGD